MGELDEKREQFENLALQHMDSLYRVALRMTGNASDAQDLVQDTYLRAYKFFDKFEKGTNFRAWMFKLMKNIHINVRKREARRPGLISLNALHFEEGERALRQEAAPEDEALGSSFDERVVKALNSLPKEFLSVVLADLNGLTYQEIADQLDIPIGTVMSRLHRARKLLQELLGDYAAAQYGYCAKA